jgi:hypothetical protein
MLCTRRGHSQKLEEQLQQATSRQAELQQQLESASAQCSELGQLVGELQAALAEQAAAAQQQAGALQAAVEVAQQQLQEGMAQAEQRVSGCKCVPCCPWLDLASMLQPGVHSKLICCVASSPVWVPCPGRVYCTAVWMF